MMGGNEELKYGLGDPGMNSSLSPSQTFVKDLLGKTHVLPFLPTVSIATNLLRHSPKLFLPPLAEIYILSGRQILKAECTILENGLHSEQHLTIMARCKGGIKSGTNGSSRDKGRGQRAPEGSSRGMGGGQTMVENNRTPLGRGRGRGGRPEARRPTILHSQSQEDMDEISRYALMTARRETLRTNLAKKCQELWATSRIIPDYGPPPPPQLRKGHRKMYLRRQKDPPLLKPQLDRLHPCQRIKPGGPLPAN